MKKAFVALMALIMILACSAAFAETEYVKTDVDHVTYGWILDKTVVNADGTVTVNIMEVPAFEPKTYTTVCSLNNDENHSEATSGTRAAALAQALSRNAFAEVRFNEAGEVIDYELIEYGMSAYMDSAT